MIQAPSKNLYAVGEQPPIGCVPEQMHAWLIRRSRFGEPLQALQLEVVDTPEVQDDEVLVYVMASGINYNCVWAGLGVPIDVIAARQKQGSREDFHIGGSEASGIVYKVGPNVTELAVGDEVILHGGQWDSACPLVKASGDPVLSPTFRAWGYETNWGSFAQFAKVRVHQCLPKPARLTWEEAASYIISGATAFRMLHGWSEHTVRPNDVVLIWGGAGGLGSMAIQIARVAHARPIAVVSSDEKREFCLELGAIGCINRTHFDHWGAMPHWKDVAGYQRWLEGVRSFGSNIWSIAGERVSPRIVFEHSGEDTLPTSMFVCDTGGMVVICGGTSGYSGTLDLRYLWMRQKRLQGSHFADAEQARCVNDLVIAGAVRPCLSRTFTFEEVPLAHQMMYENKHPYGNTAVLVGAPRHGLGSA